MIGTPGRLALGYLRRHLLMSPAELGGCQQRMAELASSRGYVLGTVHVDELHTQPQAFEDLLASIQTLDVAVVIVPSPTHIGDQSVPGSLWNRLWLDTGAEVVFTDPSP